MPRGDGSTFCVNLPQPGRRAATLKIMAEEFERHYGSDRTQWKQMRGDMKKLVIGRILLEVPEYKVVRNDILLNGQGFPVDANELHNHPTSGINENTFSKWAGAVCQQKIQTRGNLSADKKNFWKSELNSQRVLDWQFDGNRRGMADCPKRTMTSKK
jgi:hypothetical protein